SDETHAAGLRRFRELAEEIARAEKLAAMVIRHRGRIEGDDAAAVEQQRVEAERRPVVDPCADIERQRIALVQVQLPAPPHRLVPWPVGGEAGRHVDGAGDDRCGRRGQKFSTGDHARATPANVRLKPDTTYCRVRLLQPDTTYCRARLQPDTTY